MPTTIDEFVKEYEMESALTEKALDALTDESLKQAVTNKHRTLRTLAWHLVQSYNYMTYLGLTYDEPLAAEEAPDSAKAIADEYRRLSRAFRRALASQWTDETLDVEVDVFGATWPNRETLRFTLRHEIHHRGQMTVLMRQAGLRVPDIMGPTLDDWLEKGEEPRV